MSEIKNTPALQINLPQNQQKRTAFLMTLVTGLLMGTISIASLIVTRATGLNSYSGIYLTAALSVLGLISAYFCYLGKTTLGINILLSTILMASFFIPYMANGQSLPLAIMTGILVSSIANATLPDYLARRYLFASLFLGVGITIADLYLPSTFGTPSDARVVGPVSIGISILFLVPALRRFNSFTLQNKLLISFILLTIIPLLILGVYTNTITRQQGYETSTTDLTEIARLTAFQIDAFIDNQLISIFVDAQDPEFEEFILLNSEEQKDISVQKNIRTRLDALARRNTIFIRSIALLDTNGINLIDTDESNIGRSESEFEFFNQTFLINQRTATGPVFNQQNNKASIFFSSPIRNEAGRIIGVMRTEYDAGVIQSLINTIIASDDNSQVIAIIRKDTFVQIAYTGDQKYTYKSIQEFNLNQLENLQSKNKLLPGPLNDATAPVNGLVLGLQNLEESPFFTIPSLSLQGNSLTTGTAIEIVPWYVVVEQSQAVLNEPLERQNRTLIFISLGLVGLTVLAAIFVSRILTAPITGLSDISNKIASGNFNVRAAADTKDEIGSLAATINSMAEQLQQTFTGLEQQVGDRTNDLKQASMISERRAKDLQAISEVSRTISTEQKLEILLPLVTRLVSERFDFYHVGIFFVDATKQFAILQAANSEGGKRMLARGHRLEVGLTGIVGTVAQTGKPRIALDVGADATFFENPDLPETRSEMALPLNFRGETIGVLDVQSVKPGAFTEGDANTLSILADQVAIAIENARLFGQTQQAREEAEALYNQFQLTEWKKFSQEETTIGYSQSTIGGKPIVKLVESAEIREALQKGQAVVFDGKTPKTHPSISLPVKLRGQTIGVLNIKAPTKDRKWNQDEINLVQAISDRLALALDNARLLQESQRRASKEAKIGEVTAKIGASINMRNVLQTAVEELGRALPGSEVVIQFESSEEN